MALQPRDDGRDTEARAIETIVARASRDVAFRQQLLTDPRAAIQGAFGVTIPPSFRIKFIEKEPGVDALVVLPDLQRAGGELSDDDLENVAGGITQDAAWSRGIV